MVLPYGGRIVPDLARLFRLARFVIDRPPRLRHLLHRDLTRIAQQDDMATACRSAPISRR